MSRLILTVSVFVLIAGCNKNPRLTKANFDKRSFKFETDEIDR